MSSFPTRWTGGFGGALPSSSDRSNTLRKDDWKCFGSLSLTGEYALESGCTSDERRSSSFSGTYLMRKRARERERERERENVETAQGHACINTSHREKLDDNEPSHILSHTYINIRTRTKLRTRTRTRTHTHTHTHTTHTHTQRITCTHAGTYVGLRGDDIDERRSVSLVPPLPSSSSSLVS